MILVTGSSGYVARFLIPALIQKGESVHGLDRMHSDLLPVSSQTTCDLADTDAYRETLSDCSLIIHLAAAKGDWGISHDEYYRDNVQATKSLIEAADGRVANWVFYSTVSALGPSSKSLNEDAQPNPTIAYGKTKLECEQLFLDMAARFHHARVQIIRPSVVFGPHNPWNTNIFRLIDAVHRGRFVMVGDGRTFKTTSYIENLVESTLYLLQYLEEGVNVFHYVDEPVMSMEELVELIYRLLHKKRPAFRVPLNLAKSIAVGADVAADLLKIDLPITSARIEKFCTDTNFSGQKMREHGFRQPLSMEEGLERTVNWYLHDYVPTNR